MLAMRLSAAGGARWVHQPTPVVCLPVWQATDLDGRIATPGSKRGGNGHTPRTAAVPARGVAQPVSRQRQAAMDMHQLAERWQELLHATLEDPQEMVPEADDDDATGAVAVGALELAHDLDGEDEADMPAQRW